MKFTEILLEILLEGKVEDTFDRHPSIPHEQKEEYLKQIPANNAQQLDWILHQHTKGNIRPEHNINEILSNFNKVKDKLDKKQIHQYSNLDHLSTAISPHVKDIVKSTKDKAEEGTETLYSSPTMTIRQHHNYESCVKSAILPKNNKTDLDKATWCISVGEGGGASHYNSYTDAGFHPVYSIEHHHPDGTSSRHMFVYDYNVSQGKQELRDEHDKRPGFSEYNMSRPDLLDNYAEEHPEILKTPISHLFNEKGRNKYENSAQKKYDKITQITSIIPDRGVSDASYQKFFKQGQTRQYGRIHNELSRINLTPPQLDHLIKNGNESSKHLLASRTDLSPEQMKTLANTSNIAVHQNLLTNPKLTSDAFDIIANKAHAEVHDKVISHPFFTNTHLINKIKKGDNSFLQKYLYTHGTSSNENNTNDIINNISDSTMFNTLLTHHYYNNNNFLNNHQLVNIINKSNSPDILSTAVYQDNSKELRNEIVKSGNINTLLNYHQHYGLLPEHKQIVYDKLKEHINNNSDFLKNANIGYKLGGELLNDKTINIAPHNRYILKHRLYISGKNDISMSKEDIENHIHPYINDEIKNSKDDEERANILISHPHITDTHVKNLLSKGVSTQSLKSRYSSSLPFHLVNTVAKHAIKHNDDELLSSILNLHKFDRDADGNTHFDNLADDIIKTNNPKMIKFLAQNAAYKLNLTNKLINHAKSANNQEINNAVAMIPDFNVSKNFIENAIHTKNEEVMNNHILNFKNNFRTYHVTDGKLNDEDYKDLSNVAKILDHEKSKGEYNNLRVLASKPHNSSYNNGKTFFIRRMINSNDAETYHNLIDSTPHLLKPEHIEHMRKLNNASVNEKLDKLPHQPINESYQDLLYKFITEVKKNKVESNSLPILNDSTNDDSNVINHQK